MSKAGRVIPGYHLTWGITIFYLSLILIIPLGAFLLYNLGMGWDKFWQTITDYRVLHAYYISLGTSLVAALVNALFGLLLAWVLVRYDFPGRRLMDGLIDLPLPCLRR